MFIQPNPNSETSKPPNFLVFILQYFLLCLLLPCLMAVSSGCPADADSRKGVTTKPALAIAVWLKNFRRLMLCMCLSPTDIFLIHCQLRCKGHNRGKAEIMINKGKSI